MSCPRPVATKPPVSLTVDDFGTYKDKAGNIHKVKRFTWRNSSNTTIEVINYGGTITSIKLPDKNGNVEDVVTGFDNIEQYLGPQNRFFGATVGRVANRIAGGKFTLEGVEYTLAKNNNGVNHLHGGVQGFDKVLWNYYVKGNRLTLTYLSPDLEEGYPGDLLVTVAFELTESNELQIDYKAAVSKPTPVNLTNHSYFNLAGHGSGSEGLYKHQITINADKYTELGPTLVPTGKILTVAGTVFDLRVPKVLGDVINNVPNAKGYDFNFCINRATRQDVGFVLRAAHPPSGRVLELYCDQPGVQFYTGNALPEGDEIQGKGATYRKHGAFCIETQKYPDAVNHSHFPQTVVYPGEEYHHLAIFKFSLEE